MLLDRLLGFLVGRNGEPTLPHLYSLVLESCLLIKDCQVLNGREVARVDLYRRFQFAYCFEHLPCSAVQKPKMEV